MRFRVSSIACPCGVSLLFVIICVTTIKENKRKENNRKQKTTENNRT
jgi:hypothetical protein